LIVEYQESKINYLNYESKLRSRKEYLFSTGNIDKWELSEEDSKTVDRNELLSNKELAFSKMLYKDTNYCTSLKRNYGFSLTSLLQEHHLYQKNLAKRFKNHFLNLPSKNTTLLGDIFSMVKLLTFSS